MGITKSSSKFKIKKETKKYKEVNDLQRLFTSLYFCEVTQLSLYYMI